MDQSVATTCLRGAGLLGLGFLIGAVPAQAGQRPVPGGTLTAQERQEAISRASVWTPTDIPSIDIKAGPQGPGAYAFNAWVPCKYKQAELGGKSPKFVCETEPGQEVKVKYGARNAEVFGEVLASRLFWALGFAADRMYPVRVRCQGCPADPQANPVPVEGVNVFDPAAIEQKLSGRTLEVSADSGWDWSELDIIGPDAPQGARTHREAFKLLAAFIQHIDSKPANQRLFCPAGEDLGEAGCRTPVLMVSDLGLTFGRSGLLVADMNKNSVSLRDWSQRPIWKDGLTCTAQLSQSFSGTLNNPKISDAGRAFLASLLVQLTDAQIRDLFETARVSQRSSDPSSVPSKDGPLGSVDDWVRVFKLKRTQIVEQTCP
jgi:hypothetical protein